MQNFDGRSVPSLTAVIKAFNSAKAVLDHAAPAPGQHELQVGDRVVLQDLMQRTDLNACVAVVKAAADAEQRDRRVEVSVGQGKQKERLWIKPANMRLEWHVAADAHAAAVGGRVLVRSLESKARGRVCQVVGFDPQDRMLDLHAASDQTGPAAGATERVAVGDAVPASYSLVAKEVHACAMKLVLKAAGATASPAVTSALHAVRSCAGFSIRCARADETARACVTVLNLLHTGGRSSSHDFAIRRSWTEVFLVMCINEISEELKAQCCFEAACLVMAQCKNVIESLHGEDYVMIMDRIADAVARHESLDVASTLYSFAFFKEKQGRLADAKAMYKEVLRIRELKLGHESLDVAGTLSNLAALHAKQDRLSDAEATYKEVLRIRELKLGHESLMLLGR